MSRTIRVRAAAVIITALASAGLITGPGSMGSPASATPGPAASASPPVLARANLPARADLEFHRAGDWVRTGTSATLGLAPVTDCSTSRSLEKLGASTLYRRDYRLGTVRTQRAVAVALEFATAASARAGYAILLRRVQGCPERLLRLGYDEASVDPWTAVTAGDRAAYTVLDHSILNSPGAEERAFEEFGLTRAGRRVALVVMKTTGQDYNWSSVPGEDLALYPMIRSLPKIAGRLGRDLTADRHLTDAQLIKVSGVPAYGNSKISIAAPGVGRTQDAIAVCTESVGVRELKSTQVRTRSFMIDKRRPSIFTMALQYSSAEAATAAARTFRERIEVCGKQLREEGYWVGESGIGWIKAPTTRGSARFTELTYKKPGHVGDDAGYFESIGVTRVGDRLMITVSVVYGQDYNVSLDPHGDPETGLPAHPQFALLKAAANRLAS